MAMPAREQLEEAMSSRCWSFIALALSLLTPVAAVIILDAMPVHGAVNPCPAAFHDQEMAVSGGTQYVRLGGHGPAVLLLHGFGDTGHIGGAPARAPMKDTSRNL